MISHPVIVGLDEAGRGPLAGPVFAGACVLQKDMDPALMRDSKALTPEEREKAFEWIEAHCIYGFGFCDAKTIDSIGILDSTERAMHQALAMIEEHIKPTYLLIDGRDRFWFNYPNSKVIRGDSSEVCIAAASIVAKVLRDRFMIEASEQFHQYGFSQHKGYGTEEHMAAIEKYGLCVLHRKTFVKNLEPACAEKNTVRSGG